ncbi:hypothetical protein V7968_11835 [Nocardia vulneris]|uniref:hypothetical protein n=1 Tax=Nocardia vulneris TaxID=1141657 RepID=UPI0030CFA416
MGDLNRLQDRLGAEAAEYAWIDQVCRTLERVGRDPSGAVQTALDGQNFPTQFVISRDWQARLVGGRLDAAILDAVAIAYADGWQRAAKEVDDARRRGQRPPESAAPAIELAPPSGRSLGDIIEDVLALSAKSTAALMANEPEQRPRGETRVRFEFSQYGISTCEIDQQWAERHAASQVTTEINNQLIAQRDEYFATRAKKSKTDDLLNAAEEIVNLLQSGDLMRGQ